MLDKISQDELPELSKPGAEGATGQTTAAADSNMQGAGSAGSQAGDGTPWSQSQAANEETAKADNAEDQE